jgi:serine/threonine protein kinase
VHRDVSAENLFVTYDGMTQVVDFGVAHARQRQHQTDAGQVKGTFPYMAPEQMAAAVVDRRVDVWALGVVLWELLTLRRLFLKDTDVNTMYAVLSGEIEPPSAHRSDVPAELDEIVLKALQRNPDERWQTAREMGTALRRFLAKQPTLIGPAELAEWMGELFPDGEAQKRRLMEIARSGAEPTSQQPPLQARDKSGRRALPIPQTTGRAAKPAAPMPTGLLLVWVSAVTVLTVLALDLLR